jgi:hypothetical protein
MLKVIIGHSEDPDSASAVEEVLQQCCKDLMGMAPSAGILFAAIDFDHAVILEEISRQFPGLELIGCTTDGEMSSKMGFQQDSLLLVLFCSDTVEIRAGIGYGASSDPIAAAKQAVQQVSGYSHTPKLCIALPASYTESGATTDGEKLLKGLELAFSSPIPVIGGTAGDQYRLKKTYQFFGSKVVTDSLPILTFSGDILFSHGIACGWRPLGRKSLITKAKGNVLYEVDGMTAVEFYHRYLGDRLPTAENPLAIYEDESDYYYVRVPNTCNSDGSINFLANIPEQASVCVTDCSRDEIISASLTSFQTALQNYPGQKLDAVLVFSCCCRRWLLGTRSKEEYELIENAIPNMAPIGGFYTYGEFAPLEPQGGNYFHQETFITLLLGTE